MITIVRTPAGGENNELSHYAADAKLLGSVRHPSVLPVIDGRWIGDSFAVVTERVSGNTLRDELDRDLEFRNPRVAMILQDIWSGLEAAREAGVVHRWVPLDSVYFDSTSKRPIVLLSPAPIPLTGVPGAAADARTIGTLAWAMLTGAPYDPTSDRKLADLAPNLASRVVESVERMVQLRAADPAPDVPTALGVIAAGDVLKQGEIEIQAMKEEYSELHRMELEKCETHRMETEQYAAEQAALITDERALLERLAAEQSASLAAERAEFEKLMAAREERIVGLRLDLEREAARAAKGLDVEGAAALSFDDADAAQRPPRSYIPTAIAATLIGLVALGAMVHARAPRAASGSKVSVGHSAVVPSMPLVDTSRLKVGGFLSQTAGGNVTAGRRSGPPLASSHDSAAIAAAARADSISADSAARTARESTPAETVPRRPLKPREPANDVNGALPRQSQNETLAPRSALDTIAPRPSMDSARRDTQMRDTTYSRGTSPAPFRDTMVRRDTTGRISPNVRVETTYVRGSVRRDTLAMRPDTARRSSGR
jgi:hypothetical protein